MRILILEDEQPAAEKLIGGIRTSEPDAEIFGPIRSVREGIAWLDGHPHPDLILADIQLTDGISFEVFRQRTVTCPIIFATAYDEYLIEALGHTSIDYLLKPIRQEALDRALKKYLRLREHFTGDIGSMLREYLGRDGKVRERIVVRKGIDFVSVPVEEVAYFHTQHKIVFLVDRSGSRSVVDKTLTELEQELDPARFFRANRKFIVHIRSLGRFKTLEKGKLLLEITPSPGEQIVVSQENAAAFRAWAGK